MNDTGPTCLGLLYSVTSSLQSTRWWVRPHSWPGRQARAPCDSDRMMGVTAAPSHQEEGRVSPQATFPSPAVGSSTPGHPLSEVSAQVCPGPSSFGRPAGKDQTCHSVSPQTTVPGPLSHSLIKLQSHSSPCPGVWRSPSGRFQIRVGGDYTTVRSC